MTLAFQIISSPVGEILVAGTGYCVTQVLRGDDKHKLAADFRMRNDDASPLDRSGYIREACHEIADYLVGRKQRIDLAVQLDGTEFERKVWHYLRQIPYGQTSSYSAIASATGAANINDVTAACDKNPVPLVIPSHRAVGAESSRLEFVWGNEIKEFLLKLERDSVKAAAII